MLDRLVPEIAPAYDPAAVESHWYQFWDERGYFAPRIDPDRRPFTIIMPPPNVTGELHLGHALTATIEDMLVRWHRMLGDPTLWLPGRDHASIAAQVVLEQQLGRDGVTRHQLGREKFLERMWEWMDRYGRVITQQHKRLGASCDWTRERFTMDEGPSRAVRSTFVNLYRQGLIYRGERIINWCPRCSTALSDLEVEHEDVLGNLYYVRYPLAGPHPNPLPGGEGALGGESEPGFVMVATTRPETMLGDTGVAVHPDDIRYRGLVGREVVLPVVGRRLPIVADAVVDPQFGTGAVKVTPAHDPVDFEIGERHGLPRELVMSLDATMNEQAGAFRGMDRYACREALVKELERQGLLERVDPHVHSVGHCGRCKTVVEPIASKQWFVRIGPLAQPAIDAVLDGRIRFVPERFTKTYLNWLENIRDWCISRQLWWGHRIPVWYCQRCAKETVEVDPPVACGSCAAADLEQDPDVLDTWFSSALWPHSTLGWPENTEDLRDFYPTSVMETGYDILFFWVARMVMMGLANTGEVPFSVVYLHGLVRDEKGEKMSKSKGNVINPEAAIQQYGTDALRFALATGSSPGNDMKLSAQRLEASRNLSNKLWNAARFVMQQAPVEEGLGSLRGPWDGEEYPLPDRWILSRLNRLIENVDRLMNSYQLGEAGRQIADFLWGEYCDWYIEMAKIRLRSQDGRQGGEGSPLPVLVHVLEKSLRLLHPVMPFITEELWQGLVGRFRAEGAWPWESIMVAPYPRVDQEAVDVKAEWQMGLALDLIRGVRNVRSEYHVEPAHWIPATVVAGEVESLIVSLRPLVEGLARVRPLTVAEVLNEKPAECATLVVEDLEVFLPLAGLADVGSEQRRLTKELAAVRREIERAEGRLGDQRFVERAPALVVEAERERLRGHRARMEKLDERLRSLG